MKWKSKIQVLLDGEHYDYILQAEHSPLVAEDLEDTMRNVRDYGYQDERYTFRVILELCE